jgi:ankyrin repeat protein
MNFLSKYLALGFFILFSSFSTFCAHTYNEQKTEELKQYLNDYDDVKQLAKRVKKLLEQGADPGIRTGRYGRSVIHFAAEADDIGLIKLLLSYGVNIETQDECGSTPLIIATKRNAKDVIIELLGLGAENGVQAYIDALLGKTKPNIVLPNLPWVHSMILNRYIDVLKLNLTIFPQNIKVNEFDALGLTPLDIALVRRDKESFHILLEYGADPTRGRFNPRVYEWE